MFYFFYTKNKMNRPADLTLNGSSRFRDSGTIENGVYSLIVGLHEVTKVSLCKVQLYNSMYNINQNNNTIVLNGNSISVPIGIYSNGDDFAAILQTSITANIAGVTVIYQSAQNRLVFAGTVVNYTNQGSTMQEVLSIREDVSPLTQCFLNLSDVLYVNINSQTLSASSSIDLRNGSCNVLQTIPLSVKTSSLQEYRMDTIFDIVEYSRPRDIQRFDLSLRDQDNRLLDTNGINWSFVLLFWTK
jgi:hypothetical protein